MFIIDERLKGLPVPREQILDLHQSLNQPHLAVPGRRAGYATAYVLGLRGAQGCAVFVYLSLRDSGECAVYVPDRGMVGIEHYGQLEAEALAFVESMGFMMDNLNFRSRSPQEQDDLVRRLPLFQREPPRASAPGAMTPAQGMSSTSAEPYRRSSVGALGRLLSSFSLVAFLLSGCAHVSEKARSESQIRAELAAQSLVSNPREAFKEAQAAIALNAQNADAWHVKALALHHAFRRHDEALEAYRRALSLRPGFSEAHTNLGTLFVDLKRYDEAIAEYEAALNDVLYTAPFIAHANLGWALYRKGDVSRALDHLKASVTLNPGFCLGHMQLGQVLDAQGSGAEACKSFGRYREHCGENPDAWMREGVCLAKLGRSGEAAVSFERCVERARDDDVRTHCQTLKEHLER